MKVTKLPLQIARDLGITLKSIKTFNGHDGGIGLNADILVGGIPKIHIYDSADGGCYEYSPIGKLSHKEANQIVAQLNEKIDAYPAHEVSLGASKFMMKENLDGIVCALHSEVEEQKEIKKNQKKGFIIETENGTSVIGFGKNTLEDVLKMQGGLLTIQKNYENLKKDDYTILNLEYLESIGVKV